MVHSIRPAASARAAQPAQQSPGADSSALLAAVGKQVSDSVSPAGYGGARVDWLGLRPNGPPADSLPPCPVRRGEREVRPVSVGAWATRLSVVGERKTVQIRFGCDAGPAGATRVRASEAREFSYTRRGADWTGGGFRPAGDSARPVLTVAVPVVLCAAYASLLLRARAGSRVARLAAWVTPIVVALAVGLAAAPGYGEPLVVDLRPGGFARRAIAAGGYILCLTSAAAAASWAGLRVANWRGARGAWQWVSATGAGLAGTLVALYVLILGALAMAAGAH
jgi:hypothetical protein